MNEHPSVDHLKNLGSQGTSYTYGGPSVDLLETFDNPAPVDGLSQPLVDLEVEVEFPEFTSLCPKTGQPDFATIWISYRPRLRCVESKSLKLYLFAFRNEGAFMEAITKKICEDLVAAMDPLWIVVEGRFNPRGGTRLWPKAAYVAADWKEQTPSKSERGLKGAIHS